MLQLNSSERQQVLKDNVINLNAEDPSGAHEGVPLVGCDDDTTCTNGTKCNIVAVGILLNRQSKLVGVRW